MDPSKKIRDAGMPAVTHDRSCRAVRLFFNITILVATPFFTAACVSDGTAKDPAALPPPTAIETKNAGTADKGATADVEALMRAAAADAAAAAPAPESNDATTVDLAGSADVIPDDSDIGAETAAPDTESVAVQPEPNVVAPTPQIAARAAVPAGPAPNPKAIHIAIVPNQRVVRYAKANGVSVFAKASDDAPTIGTLSQGDLVMVVEENGWGRISESKFVRLAELTNKAVARSKPAPAAWQAP